MSYERSKIYCGYYVSAIGDFMSVFSKIGEPSREIGNACVKAIESGIDKELKKDEVYVKMRKLGLSAYEAAAIISVVDFSGNKSILNAMKLAGIIPNDNAERRVRAAMISLTKRLTGTDTLDSKPVTGKMKEAYDYSLKMHNERNEAKGFTKSTKAVDGQLTQKELEMRATKFPCILALFHFMTMAPNVDHVAFLNSVKVLATLDGFDYSQFVPTVN